MRNAETNIQNAIMLKLSQMGCYVWRNHVGKFRSPDGSRIVSIGVVGSSDLMAVKPTLITADMVGQTLPVFMAIEVKTATGKQSEPQKKWQAAMEKINVQYIVARSPDDV